MAPSRIGTTDQGLDRSGQHGSKGVIIVAAAISEPVGRPVSFLLSSLQVEEIVTDVRIWPVPFSSPSSRGIALWRDQFLPIISLEQRLGFAPSSDDAGQRFIVVQTRHRSRQAIRRGMIAVTPQIRSLPLPSDTRPAADCRWLPDGSVVRGVYEWQQELLIVADIETIFNQAPADQGG